MSKPKVSVIIPTYRRPDTLARAINSVLNQSYPNFEVIVVDDNDPNTEDRSSTEQLMLGYRDHPKVKYVKHLHNKNGAAARNTGIKISEGDYITFLDDDDEFLEDRLKHQVERLENLDDSWGACYTSYKKINKDHTIQNSSERREGFLYKEALMRSIYLGSGSNLMVRRSVVDKVNGFDESFKRNQDLEFLNRVLEEHKLAYVDSCLLVIHYEIRENKSTYEQMKQTDRHYLNKFGERIAHLPLRDQKAIYTMIALDSCRYAIRKNRVKEGFLELWRNKVSPLTLFRYVFYLSRRYLLKTSNGFKL